MGCCSGRVSKFAETGAKKTGGEVVDKTYFSSIQSNYFSNKQNFYRKTFNITSGENKKLSEELE